jgi:hypothetical protein
VYFYGSTTGAGQGSKFILNPSNVPGGNGTESSFLDIRGGNSGNVFALNGGIYSPSSGAPADVLSTATDAHTWGRLPAVVDATGTLTFRSAKNSANGQYLCGYQIVPNPLPVVTQQPPSQLIAPHGSDATLNAGAVGEGTLTFQWRKDGQPVTGNPSALTSKLALTNVQADDAGVYQLVGKCRRVPVRWRSHPWIAIRSDPHRIARCRWRVGFLLPEESGGKRTLHGFSRNLA